jgi:phospholipid transport system substrate-binding protein
MRLAPGTRFLLAAAGLAGLFFSAATPVHAGPATERMREFFGTVNTILNDPATRSRPLERVARVKRLVTDIADVRGAAAAALEHEWEVRTPAERDEFTRLFAELLERGLVARLAGAVSPVNGIVMTWHGETRVNDEARVMTVVESRDGRKVTIVYRMTERRGRWLVRDVVVDGISTIDNYRSQFKRLLRQGSYATLVAQLRAKLGEDTLMFAHVSPAPAPKPAEAAATARPSPAPRVVARAPAQPPAARATAPKVATAGARSVAKASELSVAGATAPLVATAIAPSVAKAAAPTTAPIAAPIAAAPTPPADTTRVARVALTPVVPPPADVVSPLRVAAMSPDVLPSALLLMLGFVGVSGAVYLRRRASASALVLQRFRDTDKHLVLLHPVPRVAKVREGRRKRRVVPPPRNPARHVDDAHGA